MLLIFHNLGAFFETIHHLVQSNFEIRWRELIEKGTNLLDRGGVIVRSTKPFQCQVSADPFSDPGCPSFLASESISPALWINIRLVLMLNSQKLANSDHTQDQIAAFRQWSLSDC